MRVPMGVLEGLSRSLAMERELRAIVLVKQSKKRRLLVPYHCSINSVDTIQFTFSNPSKLKEEELGST